MSALISLYCSDSKHKPDLSKEVGLCNKRTPRWSTGWVAEAVASLEGCNDVARLTRHWMHGISENRRDHEFCTTSNL
ncbi:hypothetical protein L484_014091 [Morus notabilis]|uniref:Uncharacterized protein n=1 Tax=Morus notabilis TaxID=981085 RepID=W9RMF9_9ROSA|nr:hypothetical protein L484_014091 [Morus notabilis]